MRFSIHAISSGVALKKKPVVFVLAIEKSSVPNKVRTLIVVQRAYERLTMSV
jgi:hypothetical protein